METHINPKTLYPLRQVALPSNANPCGKGLLPYRYGRVFKLTRTYFKDVVVIERSSQKHGSRYFLYGKDIQKFLNARIKDVG